MRKFPRVVSQQVQNNTDDIPLDASSCNEFEDSCFGDCTALGEAALKQIPFGSVVSTWFGGPACSGFERHFCGICQAITVRPAFVPVEQSLHYVKHPDERHGSLVKELAHSQSRCGTNYGTPVAKVHLLTEK